MAARAQAAGLLPLRPADDGTDEGRGAGVWIAHWGLHGAAALDLAVTSGPRAGATLAQSALSGTAAVEAYEAHKRAHLHTDHHCASEGLQFLPLVAEACSGGPSNRHLANAWRVDCRPLRGQPLGRDRPLAAEPVRRAAA